MRRFRQILTVTGISMKTVMHEERIWLLTAAVLVLLYRSLSGLNRFGRVYGTRITVYMLPVIFGEGLTANGNLKILLFLAAIALFADAPFLTDSAVLQIHFCSRKRWAAGKILYILLLSGVLMLLLSVVSSLLVWKTSVFGDGWGSTIRKLQEMYEIDHSSWSGYLTLALSDVQRIIVPETAQLYTFLCGWGVFFLMGLVIFRVGLTTGNAAAGLFLCLAFIFLDPILCRISMHYPEVLLISPVSWCSMEILKEIDHFGVCTIPYVISMLLILNGVLILSCRKKVNTMSVIPKWKER